MIRIFYLSAPATAPDPRASPDVTVGTRHELRAVVRARALPDGRSFTAQELELVRAIAERLESDEADVFATPPAVYRIVRR